ncbi:MAG: NUDIX hydrolase [Candidatus Paceibacterota bacterium]|jgi:hypothetical protein
MNKVEKEHFSAVYIFKSFLVLGKKIWYVLSVKDKRFNDLKAAGGMSNSGEDPKATAIREGMQELGVMITDMIFVHECFRVNHYQYYFLATEVSNLPELDDERKMSEIKGKKPGDSLHMRWVNLVEFSQCVYKGQFVAFKKALLKKAELDQVFAMDNIKLLRNLSV